jgi:lipoprotein-anchoring transpeptidase ErfK/SrfK
VRVDRPLAAHARPSAGSPVVGTVVVASKYYRVGIVAWVEQVAKGGRWGRVELPYSWPRRDGWIRLDGLRRQTTWVTVRVDLSRHRVTVFKRDRRVFSFPGATGAASSPTPPGEYFVTDRVPFARGSYLGSFAFGISGIQPRLPAGWSGGDQLAIHGTNSPGTIGTSASAGCIRVSEAALERLKPLLRLGTPVVIVR